ncbi:MAG: metallophosphoesterase [Candidatus Omnitrophica bacterium]|nr:metallophosphoesterase [Candidatus Omnitrophota bacterium]
MKKVSAILSTDWHIRNDIPECRTDDFIQAQQKKIIFIFNLCQKYECPLLIAGDLGHKSVWPDELKIKFIQLKNNADIDIYSIVGQHDIPNHRIEEINKSTYGVLKEDKTIIDLSKSESIFKLSDFSISSFPYGIEMKAYRKREGQKLIAMTHQLVIKNIKDWPDQKAQTGYNLLKKYPCYDLILSGDNHKTFTCEYEGRILVNPGSITRQRSDQIDHKPCVFLWYAGTNEIEQVFLPIEEGVVSKEHIEVKEQNSKAMDAYVLRLKQGDEVSLSFEDNLEEFLRANRVQKRVEEKIWRAVG